MRAFICHLHHCRYAREHTIGQAGVWLERQLHVCGVVSTKCGYKSVVEIDESAKGTFGETAAPEPGAAVIMCDFDKAIHRMGSAVDAGHSMVRRYLHASVFPRLEAGCNAGSTRLPVASIFGAPATVPDCALSLCFA